MNRRTSPRPRTPGAGAARVRASQRPSRAAEPESAPEPGPAPQSAARGGSPPRSPLRPSPRPRRRSRSLRSRPPHRRPRQCAAPRGCPASRRAPRSRVPRPVRRSYLRPLRRPLRRTGGNLLTAGAHPQWAAARRGAPPPRRRRPGQAAPPWPPPGRRTPARNAADVPASRLPRRATRELLLPVRRRAGLRAHGQQGDRRPRPVDLLVARLPGHPASSPWSSPPSPTGRSPQSGGWLQGGRLNTATRWISWINIVFVRAARRSSGSCWWWSPPVPQARSPTGRPRRSSDADGAARAEPGTRASLGARQRRRAQTRLSRAPRGLGPRHGSSTGDTWIWPACPVQRYPCGLCLGSIRAPHGCTACLPAPAVARTSSRGRASAGGPAALTGGGGRRRADPPHDDSGTWLEAVERHDTPDRGGAANRTNRAH